MRDDAPATLALRPPQGEIQAQPNVLRKVQKAGRLAALLASEVAAGVTLAPWVARSEWIYRWAGRWMKACASSQRRNGVPNACRPRRNLPTPGMPGAAASPYGVVLYPCIAYGLAPRNLLDVYVPLVRGGVAGVRAGGGGGCSRESC